MANKQQSKYWLFTINNPSENDSPAQWNEDEYQFIVYQYEIGEQGTTHIQGYIIFSRIKRLTGVKKISPRAHWETRKGTHQQCVQYCTKLDTRIPDSEPIFLGKEPQDNRKTSKEGEVKPIDLAKQDLDIGKSLKDVSESHFSVWVRYYRAFAQYRMLHTKPRNFKTLCLVIYGATGSGKSSWCMEHFPNAYWKPKGLSNSASWWDGYENQEVVIVDEFYGWMKYDYLLRLTDRYPMIVEFKGGQVQFTSKLIIFTSNKEPIQWYPNQDLSPFNRRMEMVWEKNHLDEDFIVHKGFTPDELVRLYKEGTLFNTGNNELELENPIPSSEGNQRNGIPNQDESVPEEGEEINTQNLINYLIDATNPDDFNISD